MWPKMSKEWMLKTLEDMGLKHFEAELYVYLMQHDKATAKQLAIALERRRQRIYYSLKILEKKKLIRETHGHPNYISAMDLNKVLDILIAANKKKAKLVERNREKLLEEWKKLA